MDANKTDALIQNGRNLNHRMEQIASFISNSAIGSERSRGLALLSDFFKYSEHYYIALGERASARNSGDNNKTGLSELNDQLLGLDRQLEEIIGAINDMVFFTEEKPAQVVPAMVYADGIDRLR